MSTHMIARPTQAEFKLKFDGKPNELDAATLVTSLSSLTALIEESNREIGGGARLRIAVKALDKGSFLIHLGLGPDITEAVQNLLSTVDLDTLYKVVGSVVGFFTLRKLLKGEKPKNVDEKGPDYQITTAQGNMFVVDKRTYNIYNTNPRVNDAIGTTFEALSNDPSVTGFEMLDEHDKKLFEANRLDFEPMSIRTDDLQDDKRITTVAAILTIFKVIFEDKYKWEFYYKGNRISAKMADVEFSKRVDSGERFAKGDRLQVELQIEQAFDTAANTFVNKSYQVLRVIKHLPRGAQERLDFESSDNKK